SGCFPAYVCGLLEVGEQAGRTEEALGALSRYYEDRARMDRRLRSALLYPAVMLVLMLVVIAVLLVKVLPIFDDVYASLGGRLTGLAGGLLALGRGLDAAMPVLWALLALLAAFLVAFAAVDSFRTKVMALWRGSRGDKGVSRQMNTARLAQALAMGMASGMPLEESVSLAAGLMEDIPAAKGRCLDCRTRLDQGERQGAALRESGVLPAAACRLLELGQRSGAGDSVMEKIARDLAVESEAALEEKVSRVEPALVLVCSVLVGLILLSVMLPLMHIMAAIG
ncbi:MAG: type II secretion system F family protein, partial [Oscillospiraceae bacterium]|nr:type II secretion system F family protein [Oscillospiraceae bacterium]